MEIRGIPDTHPGPHGPPGGSLPRGVDLLPHADGDEIAVGPVLLRPERRLHALEGGFLAVDADLIDERPDGFCGGAVRREGHADAAPVSDAAFTERSAHSEPQEEVLHLAGQALARRAEAELRLPARQHGGPAVGGKETVQEAGHLVRHQREDEVRNELLPSRLAPEAERREPAREAVARTLPDRRRPGRRDVLRAQIERGAEAVEDRSPGNRSALAPVCDRGRRDVELGGKLPRRRTRDGEALPQDPAEGDPSGRDLASVGGYAQAG